MQLAEWKVEAEHPRILDEKRPHLERLGPVRHGQFPPVPLHPWSEPQGTLRHAPLRSFLAPLPVPPLYALDPPPPSAPCRHMVATAALARTCAIRGEESLEDLGNVLAMSAEDVGRLIGWEQLRLPDID